MYNQVTIEGLDRNTDEMTTAELRDYCQFMRSQLVECQSQLEIVLDLLEQQTAKMAQLYITSKEGERQYQQIVETSANVIYTMDLSGHLTYINPSCEKLIDYRPVDLIGSHFSALVPGQWQKQVEDHFKDQLRDYVSETVSEMPILTRHNEQKWIEQTVTLLYKDDEIVGFHGVVQDITDRKRAEEAIRQGEERLRRITDNMLDMVIQTDASGIIEYASPSCWSVLGYTPETLLGCSLYFWIHPDDVERVREAIDTVDRVEYRCLHLGGRYLWIETISNLLFDDKGHVGGMVFASRDITKRKQAEEQLHQLNRLKSDFLSTAAHELRTPLTSIRGFSEILLTRQLDETRNRRFVNLINDQSTQLGKIIDDLLDVSRLEAGRGLKVTLEPVDIVGLIQDVSTLFIESTPSHNIQLEGFEALPFVKGDPFRLGQVCKNLLSNAIKYSPKGGTITISAKVLPDMLQIAVQDEGLGMTPEQLSHLFEKFYRANASNTAISGTGLGLAITKLIIELHGGKIWVESEHEKSSTFYFTLPLSTDVIGVGK